MNSKAKTKEEFLLSHDFLIYCKMCISSMIEYADRKSLVRESINFKSNNDRIAFENFCKDKDNNAEQWLMDNGYKDVMYSVYYKHLFFSLLVDFANYYNASVDMAYERNINVAWSLLRKPLQEILAYIEWLYIDKNELLELMIEGNDVKSYEIMSRQLKQKRKDHIDQIQAQKGTSTIDMFDFRYSYKDALTLNGIMQATNHLVTTRPALKTSPSGLNFIFLDDDIMDTNIGFYYTTIPYVMLYAMNIIMDMFWKIANLGEYTLLLNGINLLMKCFYTRRLTFEEAKEMCALDGIPLCCPECGKKYDSDEVWIDFFCNRFKCEECGKKINTYQYIFDFETINLINKETEKNEDGQAENGN